MRKYRVSDRLKKILSKLYKKDKVKYEAILRKIEEILKCEDVEHYKNLRKPLQEFKRVHIDSKTYVLTFKYQKSDDELLFYDFGHHDDVYK